MRSALAPMIAALLAGAAACVADPPDDPAAHPIVGACPEDAASAGDPYLDCVDEFLPAEGASFGADRLPAVIQGPPEGGGALGGQDVLSLGCGGEITVVFDPPAIVDGPGPDLVVFENPFALGDGTFVEPARVLVSDDGVDWRAFPCDYEARAPEPPVGCAGVGLVWANQEAGVDPLGPEAGGDRFDLAEVGLTRARYVRLVDVGEAYRGGDRMWCEGASAGFDLDAIAALH